MAKSKGQLNEMTGLYPISKVSELTGVNSVTLRAWERRYGLIHPQRTNKGHRLYTADDIDHIRHILRLVEEGVPISRVEEAMRAQQTRLEPAQPGETDVWQSYRQHMISAVSEFDEAGLEAVYDDAMSLYPVDVVNRRLLLPLLQALGERWENTEGGVAEEHFFAIYLRNKLGARFHHRRQRNRGHKLLASCIPGEHHEIGVLLFALAAHDRGFRVVLLGADMPLEELPYVVGRTDAEAIVLSSSIDPEPRVLEEQLPALVHATRVPIFIGGPTAVNHRSILEDAGAVPIGTDLVLGLRQIAERLRD